MSETDVAPASTFSGQPLVDVVAVVGVGLIGGSFAAALRQAGAATTILGAGRRPQTLAQARRLGLIDEAVTLEEAARRADLILLSVPVGATESVLAAMAPHLRPTTLLTDAGSTKADVERAARSALGDRIGQFLPGHPIAGAEASGPEASRADLYNKRVVVLTPLPENSESQQSLLRRVWEACGARVVSMQPDTHDTALASVSHMPHFLASVFMAQVAGAADSDQRMALAGTGFRDFTRIAAGSPEMWRDIFLANRKAMLDELAQFRALLDRAEQSLHDEDGQGLYDFLERAALARRLWGSRSRS
ncbi:MAG TPA: prephenate dehydrogenase/arogenate dehydrogenase family protein [Pusillimonas sp.]|uniref:prephenate dehydrogenase n=1 Tax=Pusillimonas sp. TaxID=3040095 RepID=UPI002CB24222|nr:prephenate dehydrogenase/arogenate dehydrogenase family protein [Pusillimonas sp.]HUH86868.1 prephenate dehydrogenase/arogenate dehydrogenase family protein [Pusillimonas sp.]